LPLGTQDTESSRAFSISFPDVRFFRWLTQLIRHNKQTLDETARLCIPIPVQTRGRGRFLPPRGTALHHSPSLWCLEVSRTSLWIYIYIGFNCQLTPLHLLPAMVFLCVMRASVFRTTVWLLNPVNISFIILSSRIVPLLICSLQYIPHMIVSRMPGS
jgi:hypothetical protein